MVKTVGINSNQVGHIFALNEARKAQRKLPGRATCKSLREFTSEGLQKIGIISGLLAAYEIIGPRFGGTPSVLRHVPATVDWMNKTLEWMNKTNIMKPKKEIEDITLALNTQFNVNYLTAGAVAIAAAAFFLANCLRPDPYNEQDRLRAFSLQGIADLGTCGQDDLFTAIDQNVAMKTLHPKDYQAAIQQAGMSSDFGGKVETLAEIISQPETPSSDDKSEK